MASLKGEIDALKLKVKYPPSLYSQDLTEEKLASCLYEQNGTYCIVSPDARNIVDNIAGKYNAKKGTSDSIYLLAIWGDEIRSGRVNVDREDIVISEGCLNMCLFLQPDKAEELMSNPTLSKSGLNARTLPISVRSSIGERFISKDTKEFNESKMEDYKLLLKRLALYKGEEIRVKLSYEGCTTRVSAAERYYPWCGFANN